MKGGGRREKVKRGKLKEQRNRKGDKKEGEGREQGSGRGPDFEDRNKNQIQE